MYKDGEFKEGISRSDFDMTKKAEVWDGLHALTKEEAEAFMKPREQKIGATIIDIEGIKRVKFI